MERVGHATVHEACQGIAQICKEACRLDGKTEFMHADGLSVIFRSNNLSSPKRLACAIHTSPMNGVPAFVDTVDLHVST